jgi:hypothetical protein
MKSQLFIMIFASAVTAHAQQLTPLAPTTGERGTENVPLVIKEDARDHQEHATNERIALYTTIVLTAITAALAIFTGALWWATRRLVTDARVTAEKELRAYLYPDATFLAEGLMLNPSNPAHANEPGVGFAFRNLGKTPATKTISWAQIKVIHPAQEQQECIVPPLVNVSVSIAAPGQLITKLMWFGRPLTTIEIAEIQNHVRAIYLYGRIEYEDVFGAKQFTNFRLRYSGQFPPPQNVLFNYCDSGNDAS